MDRQWCPYKTPRGFFTAIQRSFRACFLWKSPLIAGKTPWLLPRGLSFPVTSLTVYRLHTLYVVNLNTLSDEISDHFDMVFRTKNCSGICAWSCKSENTLPIWVSSINVGPIINQEFCNIKTSISCCVNKSWNSVFFRIYISPILNQAS